MTCWSWQVLELAWILMNFTLYFINTVHPSSLKVVIISPLGAVKPLSRFGFSHLYWNKPTCFRCFWTGTLFLLLENLIFYNISKEILFGCSPMQRWALWMSNGKQFKKWLQTLQLKFILSKSKQGGGLQRSNVVM